tara:strand:- start:469 stop:996 length:528 start_codon:yes stop_codon:yes gene_type:complete
MAGYLSIDDAASTPIHAFSIAQVSVTHPAVPALTAVVGTGLVDLDPSLGGFATILNAFGEILNKGSVFTTLADGRVQVNVTGTVKITAYADFSHSVNNSTAGAAFAITRGGSTVYSSRSVHTKMPNAGDIGHVAGVGALDAVAGDIIGIAVASDITGNISVRAASVVLEYLGDYS